MNKADLYIDMQVTHNKFGICTIQNIWTYKDEKFISLKLNEPLKFNKYILELLKDYNVINYITDSKKTKIEFLHYSYSNIFEYVFISQEDNNFNKHGQIIQSSFNDEDFRNKWPREHQCEDGHYVRSLSEMIIDNWLYNHDIMHAYEKSVFMKSNPDAIVLSDFYIKNGDVYIEFWGLEDDEKYLKRKEEKIKLYEENNYKRIDLTEKDIKRLNDILPKLLSQYLKK